MSRSSLAARLRAQLEAGHRADVPLLGEDVAEVPGFAEIVRAPAAVLVAIVDREEPGLLLTVRSDRLRRHAGQIAFPGGRLDAEDEGPVAAALREAHEEIGLPTNQVEIVGTTDRYRTITGFEVTPVLGVVPPDLPLAPHEAEVAELFEAPLSYVLDPAHQIESEGEFRGVRRRYIEILWQRHRIWGATAAMLANLGRRLAAGR